MGHFKNHPAIRTFSPFWRFQIFGWTAFSISMFPIYYWQEGSILGAACLSILADGTGFLITLGIRQISQVYWPTSIAYLIGFIAPICGFGAALQIALIHLVSRFTEINRLDISASEEAFRLYYGRAAVLIAWCLLYFGIRSLIEETRRKMRQEMFLERSAHNPSN